jgi:hypothetical protein
MAPLDKQLRKAGVPARGTLELRGVRTDWLRAGGWTHDNVQKKFAGKWWAWWHNQGFVAWEIKVSNVEGDLQPLRFSIGLPEQAQRCVLLIDPHQALIVLGKLAFPIDAVIGWMEPE